MAKKGKQQAKAREKRARAGRERRKRRKGARSTQGPAEHLPAMWKGLRTNDLQVVATDHCPFCFKEQKELGLGDFSKIPNGLPGVEHRMDLLHQGVVDGHILMASGGSRHRLVAAGADEKADAMAKFDSVIDLIGRVAQRHAAEGSSS